MLWVMDELQKTVELIRKFQRVCGESWEYAIDDLVYGEKSETVHVEAYKDGGKIRDNLNFILTTNETECEMLVHIEAKSMQDAYQNEFDVQMYWESPMWEELQEHLRGFDADIEPGDTDPIEDDGGGYEKFTMTLVMQAEKLEHLPTMDTISKCIEWIKKETEEFDPHWADD